MFELVTLRAPPARVRPLYGRRVAIVAILVACAASVATPAAQGPLRKIGELRLTVVGLSATVNPGTPVVPKNTPAGVRVVVRGSAGDVGSADLARFFGDDVHVEADYSGPGLLETLSLSTAGEPDRLLLRLPAVQTSGDYFLSNVRLVAGGRGALDVTPSRVPVQVIEQVLITSVTTRPLTLDEIRSKGIVLDRDDYLGFEFTMGVLIESRAVQVKFPVVFDRTGTPLPEFTFVNPQVPSPHLDLPSLPFIMPTMLTIEAPDNVQIIPRLNNGMLVDVRIPGVLVIPGNVGYLKQFFSAQLFVANGAPGGSGLTVRDLTGTIRLPAGDDHDPGTTDDPLSLAKVEGGPAPAILNVTASGPDGAPGTADDVVSLQPGEQGQAEFLIRGDQEGFHNISFDIAGTLDGLATGPVTVKGKANGAVLVRNPYFDMTFTVPSVVRSGERFKLFATITNKSEGSLANDLTVGFDASRMSGMRLHADETGSRQIDTLRPGDSKTFQFDFVSERTGQVVASYLRFHTETGSNGTMRFTAGVGERGIALSPDTLVLPASIDALPSDVVEAAMRVVGQAWSISLATSDTRPAGVLPIARAVALAKGVALAEAGLRATLGQPVGDSLRDFVLDFYGPAESGLNAAVMDPGFDQLLRATEAGHALRRALGAALGAHVETAGGVTEYQREWAAILASGSDRLTFALSGAPADVAIIDAAGGRTEAANVPNGIARSDVASAVILPASDALDAPLLGVVTQPLAGPYTIELSGRGAATPDLAVSVTRHDGTTVRALIGGVTVEAGRRTMLRVDASQLEPFVLEEDVDGEGPPATSVVAETLVPGGAHLVSANVIGPETFPSASPLGKHTVLLFDRAVDPEQVMDIALYTIPKNRVVRASRVLSGRFVIAELEQPEGRYMPTSMTVEGIADLRGTSGPRAEQPLGSRVTDMGAVVSGRVFSADGVAVGGLEIFYSNVYTTDCSGAVGQLLAYKAKIRTDADGSYQFRYVRKDTECGSAFVLTAQDPQSGSVRKLSRHVQAEGERIVLDLGLFGRGTVSGVVRDLAGQPVGGAHIVVFSETDDAIQESALTDGTGRYTIPDVLVGPVNVVARKAYDNGATVRQGTSGGNLTRAGGAATVDVVIDTGSASVSGAITHLVAGVAKPAAGALVIYRLRKGFTDNYDIAAGQLSGPDGSFSFPSVPVGPFRIDVTLTTHERGSVAGLVAIGQVLEGLTVIVETAPLATIRGRVRRADNSSVAGAMVRRGERATSTDASGAFEITRVEVQPAQPHTLTAETPDRRKGAASVLVTQPGIIENVVITLSALGSVELTVLNPDGTPVPNQAVDILADSFGLRGACALGCGCSVVRKTTDASGRVRFDGLAAGLVLARATRSTSGFRDVAEGRATIVSEGHLARGVMRYEGFGSIAGLVLDPEGRPAVGAGLSVKSRQMDIDSCSMTNGVSSHAIRTDHLGRFALASVGVGPVSLLASHAFLPTPVGAALAITRAGESRDVTLRLIDTFAGELSGRVLLPDGATSAGAGVDVTINGPLPDITVRTGTEGQFRFARILPAGRYTMTVTDPVTGAVAQEHVHLNAGQDVSHEVRLKGRGTVRVRVVDALDAPVGDVVVRLQETSYPNRLLEGYADESSGGVVSFERVFEGPIGVTVSDPFARGGRASGTVPGPGSTIDVKVRISITGTVRGRFLMPDGTPIPYGIVTLSAGGREIGQATTAGTEEVGTFEFLHVPAGPVRLQAHEPASARGGIAAGTLTSEGELLLLDVRAQGLGTVMGVVTAGGAPQPAALVDLDSGSFRVRAVADGEGRYSISGVPEGLVSVRASVAGGIQTGSASGTLAGDGTELQLDVAVRDTGRLTGTIVPAVPGPLSQVIVRAGAGSNLGFTAATDAEGRFVFERLPAGRIRLTADVIGSIDTGSLTIDLPGSETTDVQLALQGVGSIRGRALDSNDVPTAGSLTLRGTGVSSYSIRLTIGVDGLFEFPELLAGPVTVTFESMAGSSRLYGNTSAVVVPGEEAVLDVRLQESATIVGLVVRADGSTPAIGADATIRLTGSSHVIPVQVQTDGGFTALGVPLGAFTLSLTDPFTGGVALVRDRETAVNGETLDLGTIVLDDTPVAVASVNPPDGAASIAIDREILLTFSDPLQSVSGVQIKKGTTIVSSTESLSADGRTVTLRPTGSTTWPDASDLTVVAKTTVTDLYGRHPAQEFTSRFHTVDLSPPAVTSTVPAHAAIQVGAAATAQVTFNEPLAAETNLETLVTMIGPGGPVAGGTVLTAPAVATFTPAALLPDNALYSVIVNGAVDASGNQQTVPHAVTFATLDTVPPALTVQAPSEWESDGRPQITIGLDDAVSGIDSLSGTLAVDGIGVSPTRHATSMGYKPPVNLPDGVHTLTATVADRAGNVSNIAGSFGVDTTPPSAAVLSGVSEGQVIAGSVTLHAEASDGLSGVDIIRVLRDGSLFMLLHSPSFQGVYATLSTLDGPHTLTAVAVDRAGNTGPAGPAVRVIVDNDPLVVTLTAPAAGKRSRTTIVAKATVNEVVAEVEFAIGSVRVIDTTTPYQATLDLSTVPEGTPLVTATAVNVFGQSASGSVAIVIDRTPPVAPDVTRINAEPPSGGISFVHGEAGAVEAGAVVDIVHTGTGATDSTVAGANGSFTAGLAAQSDDVLSITATDDLGNGSAASLVAVRQTPSPVADEGAASLRFEGLVADLVAPGLTTAALAPDGVNDAVFSFSMSVGEGLTRQLAWVDLELEDGGVRRGTTGSAGVSGLLGVAFEAGGPLINAADGSVALGVTSEVSLALFASNDGFIQEGATYRARAAYADGSIFSARFRIVAAADAVQVAHSATIATDYPTVTVTPGSPATTLLTITEIRDIDGTLVPDGARIALSAANLASKDPRGNSIVSAGGLIEGGEPAANHTDFRVFTIVGGTVTATYSSGSVMPAPLTGAHAVVQMLGADANDNVIGQQVVATRDLNIKLLSDQATVHVSPGSLYADEADRRASIAVFVRTATGTPAPDGTRVYLRAFGGGAIVGGSAGAFVPFTVMSGGVTAQYSSTNVSVTLGDTPPVETIAIRVHPANTNGTVNSSITLGTAELMLVPAAGAEFRISPSSVPFVSTAPTAQVIVHHVHDLRGNLVPDGANFLMRTLSGWTYRGGPIASFGGNITDGIAGASGNRLFTLDFGRMAATYTPWPAASVSTIPPGQDRIARVGITAAQPDGVVVDSSPTEAVAVGKIFVVAPTNAVGSASPASLLSDGALRTATVMFGPVLDAFGNPLPEGSAVLAKATGTVQQRDASGNQVDVTSAGGQIMNGTSSEFNLKELTVTDGAVSVIYGTPTTTSGVGVIRTAYVSLLERPDDGGPVAVNTIALGLVPIQLTGMTSASGVASPSSLFADGADRRAMLTFSSFRDALGEPVPAGAKVIGRIASGPGTILNGDTPQCCATVGRVFTIANGQIVIEYSAQNAFGPASAVIQIFSANSSGSISSSTPLASVTVQLLAPVNGGVVTITPDDLLADDGNRQAYVTVTGVKDSLGNPLPDGAKVVMRTNTTDGQPSKGTLAGTVPGDGLPTGEANHWSFSVANGEVRAIYTGTGVYAGPGISRTKFIDVYAGRTDGTKLNNTILTSGTVLLHGTTFATVNGPASVQSGSSATVTVSGIKDNAGNLLPDGSKVVVELLVCYQWVGCSYSVGPGVTFDAGELTSDPQKRVFAVTDGAVEVSFTVGSTELANYYSTQLRVYASRLDGSQISNSPLTGGQTSIPITP